MSKFSAGGVQYAALPYRIVGGRVEVMLITSRQTRRWVIPKGWPITGLRPHQAAAREALEEAGLLGATEHESIGGYDYMKGLKSGRETPVRVTVFAMVVEGQAEAWAEMGQREFEWIRYREAAVRVAEPGLQKLIRRFGEQRTPRPNWTLVGAIQRRLARPR